MPRSAFATPRRKVSLKVRPTTSPSGILQGRFAMPFEGGGGHNKISLKTDWEEERGKGNRNTNNKNRKGQRGGQKI